jgi:hypothetical protein
VAFCMTQTKRTTSKHLPFSSSDCDILHLSNQLEYPFLIVICTTQAKRSINQVPTPFPSSDCVILHLSNQLASTLFWPQS